MSKPFGLARTALTVGPASAILRGGGHENSGSDDVAPQMRNSATLSRSLVPSALQPCELRGNGSELCPWLVRIGRWVLLGQDAIAELDSEAPANS